MSELFAYIKSRAAETAFFLVTEGMVLLLHFLGGDGMAEGLYEAGVIAFFFAAIFAADGLLYIRRRRKLSELSGRVLRSSDALPEPADALGADYTELLRDAIAAREEVARTLSREQSESLSYYTLWVHQIKTPIAALRLILSRHKGEDGGLIEQELFKIERYAEMALKYAKLTDIADDLIIEEFELSGLLRECVKKYALLFVYGGLSVEIEAPETTVTGDRRWTAFIIEQLISNAVKYTRRGGIKLSFSDNTLYVADTGIGIRSEDIPRIFERGYTGFNGRADGRASGIGLFLARRAALSLGITLGVSSEVGRGTVMSVKFPEAERIYE